VRTSLAVLGFIKTPLFKGEMNQSHFLMLLMHVDTVGDAIIDTLYAGFGNTLFYPGILAYLSWIVSLNVL
jgi:all-trans-retinol dehydrogenase (NAD+)